MRRAGSTSWEFGHGIEQLPHAALYVRDVVGLEPADATPIPPRLAGKLPDRRDVLDEEARAEASAQWPAWWRAVVVHEARRSRAGRSRAGRSRAGSGAPAALAGLPALRQAVSATFDEACRWADDHRRAWFPSADLPAFEWTLVRDVAEEVAARNRVPAEAVRGYAVVLIVDGTWWAGYGNGVTACSVACSRDPDAARLVLSEAFESGLRRAR